jgi:tetratricopeptide (TPR) repeat protein
MSTGEAAVTSAENALASAQRQQDKRAEAKALQECIRAYAELPDTFEGLKAAKELLKVQKQLGDTKGQAQALLTIGELHFSMNNLEDALKHEEEALDIFSSVGDLQSQESVKEALSQVYNKQGQVELAPNRSKGLAALSELGRAIEANDKTRFGEAMERCKRMSSVSDKDIEDKLAEALEKDYLPAARLFKDVLDMEGLLPENKATFVHNRWHYMGFRTMGGLHYGPAFKTVQFASVNIQKDELYYPVQVPDGQEGWEYEVAYNAGVLDGIIQGPFSGGICGFSMANTEETYKRCREQGYTSAGDGSAPSALDY